MKKVLIGVAGLLVVLGGIGLYVFLSAGDIVKQVVERVGSRATQAEVTLHDVELSLTSGDAVLSGFRMGNPSGFESAKAMSFERVTVRLDTATLADDIIVLKEVVIARPEIIYEITHTGGSNIGTIKKNVNEFATAVGGGAGPAPEQTPAGGRKLVIEDLHVRDGRVAVSATFLEGRETAAALPPIHLRDIGKGQGGALPAEVADRLITAIAEHAARAVSTLDLGEMMGRAQGAADDARKLLEGGAGDAGRKLDDATRGIGDSLEGLLGK